MAAACFLGPGVPTDRAAALRKAFEDTMKDPQFLAMAKKLQDPRRADERGFARCTDGEIIATPKEIVELAK